MALTKKTISTINSIKKAIKLRKLQWKSFDELDKIVVQIYNKAKYDDKPLNVWYYEDKQDHSESKFNI
jgi:hypothetical protein